MALQLKMQWTQPRTNLSTSSSMYFQAYFSFRILFVASAPRFPTDPQCEITISFNLSSASSHDIHIWPSCFQRASSLSSVKTLIVRALALRWDRRVRSGLGHSISPADGTSCSADLRNKLQTVFNLKESALYPLVHLVSISGFISRPHVLQHKKTLREITPIFVPLTLRNALKLVPVSLVQK